MDSANTSQPRPRWLLWASAFFLIAPFVNILLCLIFKYESWEGFNGAIEMLWGIPWNDWLWLLLMLLSGILLRFRHKTFWLIAILSLFLALTLNVISLLDPQDMGLLGSNSGLQALFTLIMGASVILVLFYARYPYLDRRQGWFRPTAQRFDINLPVKIVADELVVMAVSESLSKSGCRIKLTGSTSGSHTWRFVELSFLDCEGVRIKAQVVGVSGDVIRLKFRDFILGQRKAFEDWVESRAGKTS